MGGGGASLSGVITNLPAVLPRSQQEWPFWTTVLCSAILVPFCKEQSLRGNHFPLSSDRDSSSHSFLQGILTSPFIRHSRNVPSLRKVACFVSSRAGCADFQLDIAASPTCMPGLLLIGPSIPS